MIYLFIIIFLALAAVICFLNFINYKDKYSYNKLRFKKDKYEKFKDFVVANMIKKELNKEFKNAGLKITLLQYQIIRYVFTIVFLLLTVISYNLKGSIYPSFEILCIVFLYLITMPKKTIGGKKTPFKFVIEFFTQKFNYRKNLELYRALSQLKNLIIAKQDNPISSQFILEQLKKFTTITRPIFNKMIYLWSLDKKEQACEYFVQAINTKEADNFANLIIKLDNLNPMELKNQIILYQESLKKERETNKLKTNENKSNLLYFIVIISSMIVLINFVVVIYLIDTFKMFNNLI